MTEEQNKALYIAEQCRKAGMTLAGAAGVIANIQEESAFRSNNVEDRSGIDNARYTAMVDAGGYDFETDNKQYYGYGLAQWTASDRKAGLLAYMRRRGVSIGDFAAQVDYLIYEMSHGYLYAWTTCTGTNDAYQAGYMVCKYYEIPADTENKAQYRGSIAKEWYKWLAANQNAVSGIETGGTEGTTAANPTTTAPADDSWAKIPASEYWPPRMVCEGMKGKDIEVLCAVLKARGWGVNYITDYFGDLLTEQVKAFQAAYRLDTDGIVGPLTWAELLKL